MTTAKTRGQRHSTVKSATLPNGASPTSASRDKTRSKAISAKGPASSKAPPEKAPTAKRSVLADAAESPLPKDPSPEGKTTDSGLADGTPTERAIGLFETLPPYAPSMGRYNPADRYRDFRKVLIDGGASAAEARRVLWQIFEETRLFHTPIGVGDAHLTYARIGKQEIGRWLLTVLTAVPGDAAPAPAHTINKRD